MMELAAVADGARWVLVLLFTVAAIEKAETLRSRASAWHPAMLASTLLRRNASRVMGASLVADLAAVAFLLLSPRAGGLLSAMLVAAYSFVGVVANADSDAEGCRCFWKVLNTTTKAGLVARNGVLLALAVLVSSSMPMVSFAGLGWAVTIAGGVATISYLADRQSWLASRVAMKGAASRETGRS